MNRREVKISDLIIGDRHKIPFIAEIGVNHLGNYERAKKMVDNAVEGGAEFIKFQTYIATRKVVFYTPKVEFEKLLFYQTQAISKWEDKYV